MKMNPGCFDNIPQTPAVLIALELVKASGRVPVLPGQYHDNPETNQRIANRVAMLWKQGYRVGLDGNLKPPSDSC